MHMTKNIRVQYLMATKHCNNNGDRIKVIHVVIIIIIIYSQYWNSSNSTRQNIGKKQKKQQ